MCWLLPLPQPQPLPNTVSVTLHVMVNATGEKNKFKFRLAVCAALALKTIAKQTYRQHTHTHTNTQHTHSEALCESTRCFALSLSVLKALLCVCLVGTEKNFYERIGKKKMAAPWHIALAAYDLHLNATKWMLQYVLSLSSAASSCCVN